MKKISKAALILGAGMFMVTLSIGSLSAQDKPKGKEWKAPDAEAKKKSAVKSDEATLKAGKDIWGQQCKSCHGVKGQGDGPKAEKIDISCGDFTSAEVQGLSEGALFWKITEGRKPMPSFNEKLSETERWQVVAYIKTLKK